VVVGVVVGVVVAVVVVVNYHKKDVPA